MYIIHFKNIILNPCVLDVRICLSCSVMVRIAGCQVQMTALNGFPFAAVIYITVSCTSHQALNFSTKWFRVLTLCYGVM